MKTWYALSMELKEKVKAVNERKHDAIQALDADLETGSHHGNNRSSKEFVEKYHRFTYATSELYAAIEILAEEFRDEND